MHDWHVSINEGEAASPVDLPNYPVCVKMNGGVRFDLRTEQAEELAAFLATRKDVQDPRSEFPFGSYQGRHCASWTEAGSVFVQPSAEGAPRALLSEDSAKRLAAVMLLHLITLNDRGPKSDGPEDSLSAAKKRTDDNLRRVFG